MFSFNRKRIVSVKEHGCWQLDRFTVVLSRLNRTLLNRVQTRILSNIIRLTARQLATRHTVGRRIAPMITRATLPTHVIQRSNGERLRLARRAIIVPVRRMPNVKIRQTMRVTITILHITITHRRLGHRPMSGVLNVGVDHRRVISLLQIIIRHIRRLGRLEVIKVTLSLRRTLGYYLIVIKIVHRLGNILRAVRVRAIRLMRVATLIRTVNLRHHLIRLLSLHG